MNRAVFQPTYQAQMISGAPDPTRAFTAASEAFGKISDSYLKQEALEREQARWDQEYALREQAAARDTDLFNMKKEEYEHGKQQREAQKALMPAIADINSAVLGTDQGLLQQFNDSAVRAADRVQKAVFDSDAGLKKDWDALTKDREKATPDQLKALDQREAVLRDRFNQGASKLGATLDQAATAALEGFTPTREQANRAVMQMAANSGYDLDPASLDALLARNKDTLSTRKELQAEQAAIAKEHNDQVRADQKYAIEMGRLISSDARWEHAAGKNGGNSTLPTGGKGLGDFSNEGVEGSGWFSTPWFSSQLDDDQLRKKMTLDYQALTTTGLDITGPDGKTTTKYRLDPTTADTLIRNSYLKARVDDVLGTSVKAVDIDTNLNSSIGELEKQGLLVDKNGVLTLKTGKGGNTYDSGVVDYLRNTTSLIDRPVKSQTVDQIQRSALTAPFERLGGTGSRLPAPSSTTQSAQPQTATTPYNYEAAAKVLGTTADRLKALDASPNGAIVGDKVLKEGELLPAVVQNVPTTLLPKGILPDNVNINNIDSLDRDGLLALSKNLGIGNAYLLNSSSNDTLRKEIAHNLSNRLGAYIEDNTPDVSEEYFANKKNNIGLSSAEQSLYDVVKEQNANIRRLQELRNTLNPPVVTVQNVLQNIEEQRQGLVPPGERKVYDPLWYLRSR